MRVKAKIVRMRLYVVCCKELSLGSLKGWKCVIQEQKEEEKNEIRKRMKMQFVASS